MNLKELMYSLDNDFCKGLITLNQVETPINTIDLSRITSMGFRILTSYNQLYSDTISEMIASPYKYHYTTYFILDTKFLIWKHWLERILLLYRFNIVSNNTESMKEYVISLTEYSANCYESHLKQSSGIYDRLQIEKFLVIHSETYDRFCKEVYNAVSIDDTSAYGMIKSMKMLSDSILFWMNYTIFEVLSLDRCIHNGGEVLISNSVISAKLNHSLDLVQQLRNQGLTVNSLIFTDSNLRQYEYLFGDSKR